MVGRLGRTRSCDVLPSDDRDYYHGYDSPRHTRAQLHPDSDSDSNVEDDFLVKDEENLYTFEVNSSLQSNQVLIRAQSDTSWDQYRKPPWKVKQTRSWNEETEHKLLDARYRLDDRDIDKAMGIIQKQFPNIGGLQDTSVVAVAYMQNISDNYKGKFIQIQHNGHNHWVTITNLRCDPGHIKVYDSFYRNPTSRTRIDISCLVSWTDVQFFLDLPRYQKQRCKGDCGLFAIAAMVALAYGSDPSDEVLDWSRMRRHLVECFSAGRLDRFPGRNESSDDSPVEFLEEKSLVVLLCSSCRIAFGRTDMVVKCSVCMKTCHGGRNCTNKDGSCKVCSSLC